MELSQLKYFRMLCETKNITNAAERLYISRQCLSASMKRLEDELGVPLLIRKKEGIHLTEYGEILQSYAQKQHQLHQEYLQKIEATKKKQKEIIRISLINGLCPPGEIQKFFVFEEIYPSVTIEILDSSSKNPWDMMLNKELDIAYTVRPPSSTTLEYIPLSKCEQYILLSTKNILSQKEIIDFSTDLRGQTLLEIEFRMSTHKDLLRSLDIGLKMIQGDTNIIRTMIARNKGCVITPPSLIHHFSDHDICIKPLINLPPELDLNPYLVYRPDLSPNAMQFIRYLCEKDNLFILS